MFTGFFRALMVAAFVLPASVSIAGLASNASFAKKVDPSFVGTWVEANAPDGCTFQLKADGTVSSDGIEMAKYERWCYTDGKLCLITKSGQEVVAWADPFMDGYFWTGDLAGHWDKLYKRQ